MYFFVKRHTEQRKCEAGFHIWVKQNSGLKRWMDGWMDRSAILCPVCYLKSNKIQFQELVILTSILNGPQPDFM